MTEKAKTAKKVRYLGPSDACRGLTIVPASSVNQGSCASLFWEYCHSHFLQSKAAVESEDDEDMDVDSKPVRKAPTKSKAAKKEATPPSDAMDVDPDVSEPEEAEDSDAPAKKSKKVSLLSDVRL